jgi:nucleotide-binding universal stress UspA family protein
LRESLDCAKAKGAGVDVISVVLDTSGIDLEISASERERVGQRMEQRADSVVKEAGEVISRAGVKAECQVVIATSSVADAILEIAEERKTDLIIMGSRGLSPSSRFKMGSVASQVVKYSDCSVYVVKLPL